MGESLKPEIRVFTHLEKASRSLAEKIVEEAGEAIEKRGRFTLVLSGGKTPGLLYSRLASEFATKIDWSAVHLFWGDERYVPQGHQDSNFCLVYQALISKVPLLSPNVHRIDTGLENPDKAAEAYEESLREFFQVSEAGIFQTFDVTLLGMGKDGHTASLFPGSSALAEKSRWVVAVNAPPSFSPKERITLTLPVINKSISAFFLISGPEKRSVLKSIFEDPGRARRHYPAAMVQARTKLIWYVDKDAYGQ